MYVVSGLPPLRILEPQLEEWAAVIPILTNANKLQQLILRRLQDA